MSRVAKLLLTFVTLCAALVVSAGGAAARNRLELSTTAILASTRELRFTAAGRGEIICDVTLHITALSRLFNKVRGTLVGRVTAILTANAQTTIFGATEPLCAGLVEPPMLVLYDSITGTLPTITGGRLIVSGGFLIGIRAPFLRLTLCLYRGEIPATSNRNPITRLTVTPTTVPLFEDGLNRSGAACPSEGIMEQTQDFALTPELTLRLLETR